MSEEEILPIFYSHYSSGGKSILSLDKKQDTFPLKEKVSIFDIVKRHELKEITLVDDNLSGFYKAYTNAEKEEIVLKWGLQTKVCSDIKVQEKTVDLTESEVIVFMKNSQGYEDLLKLNRFCNEAGYNLTKEYARTDWDNLNKLLTENLVLAIPFYNSFLHKNLFTFNAKCFPSLPKETVFFNSNYSLPFDSFLSDSVIKYCTINKFKYYNTHNIYCYLKSDTRFLQVNRCIQKGGILEKPELNHFSSEEFSFESYKKNN